MFHVLLAYRLPLVRSFQSLLDHLLKAFRAEVLASHVILDEMEVGVFGNEMGKLIEELEDAFLQSKVKVFAPAVSLAAKLNDRKNCPVSHTLLIEVMNESLLQLSHRLAYCCGFRFIQHIQVLY